MVAREFGPPVRVVETTKGSKTLALNLGDAAAATFPRIYLDADILLSSDAVKSIVRALTETDALAVAPRMKVDLSGRNWAIRAFYDVWLKTPYHLRGMIGSGVYALSQQGRSRFQEFPDIIADDAFVRAHFGPTERVVLEDCSFTVIPPKTLYGLLKIKTRSALGNKELSKKYPELMQNLAAMESVPDQHSPYWRFFAQPRLWPKICVYALVKSIAAIRAKAQLRVLSAYRWERDDTSRA